MYEIFLKLITEKGLTPYKVSKDTGISNTTFSAWKNGKITLSPKKLVILADYLGVTVDYLMGRDETPPQPQFSPIDQMIICDLLELDEISKRRVLEFIQFLKFQNFEEKNKKPPQK